MNNLLNLYLDESGRYFIGDPDYRFFILTAVVLTPPEKQLADLLFSKWRRKYLTTPDRCVHAVDIFENLKQNYKKPEVYMPRNFSKSIRELQDIISHLSFEAETYYIDLPKLRKIMSIKPPPKRIAKTAPQEEKLDYDKQKLEWDQHFESIIAEKDKILPLILTLQKAFNFFSKKLTDDSKSPNKGYINYESQNVADINLLSIFHKSSNADYKRGGSFATYGNNILGINLHTKGSLEGGIELADLISYIACQTLRSNHSREELKDIPEASLKLIRKTRLFMRNNFSIPIIDITSDVLTYKNKKS